MKDNTCRYNFSFYHTILGEWEKMQGTYYKTGVDTLAEIKSEDISLSQEGFQMFA